MTQLTRSQAMYYALAAGFKSDALDVILAIAQCESSLRTDATNTAGNTPPSTDRGILQINSYWHPEVSDTCAFDPACAFIEGYRISNQGTSFTPWNTYTNGCYKKYIGGQHMVDYPGAIDMLVPDNQTFNSLAPLVIVLHCTGGDQSLAAIHNTFLSTRRSAHFGVNYSGNVAQFVPLARGAGGNCCADNTHDPFWDSYINKYGNLNLCTISIEHCNDGSQSRDMTPAQLQASQKLVLWLCERYGIHTSHIMYHSSIDATNCPGTVFMQNSLPKIKQYVIDNSQSGGINPHMEQAIKDHFLSYYNMLANLVQGVVLPSTTTGIYQTYHDLYVKGTQLGPATSYEYDTVDWAGKKITAQDFGSYRIEWVQSFGPSGVFGPTKVALP